MNTYEVYQAYMTREMVNSVNTLGWDKVSWGNAMADLSLVRKENAAERVTEAMNHDLYKHTKTIKGANDLEDAFDIGNYMSDHGDIVTHIPSGSLSVGNVLVDEAGNGYVCLTVGWHRLSNLLTNALVEEVNGQVQ